MKISGQLLWTDYLKAQFLHMRPGKLTSILRYVIFGLVGLAVLAGMFAGGVAESWVFYLPILLLFVAIPLYYYVFLPRRVRGLFEQHKELGAPVEHEITPEGLITTSQYGNSNRPWSLFRKWKESKDLLMLYLTDVQFIMIPRRFFTDEQFAALHAYLDQNKVLEASRVRTNTGWRTALWIVLLLALVIAFYVGFRSQTP